MCIRDRDQQRGPQVRDPVGLRLPADVVQEPPTEAERPPADQHVGLPTGPDLRRHAGQHVRDVRRVAGAPMVTTAVTSGTRSAAARTAAPPTECPTSNWGPPQPFRRKSAPATRSSIDELK